MVVELVQRGGRFNESVSCGVWFPTAEKGIRETERYPSRTRAMDTSICSVEGE